MPSRPSPEALHQGDCRLIAELSHADMAAFLRPWLRPQTGVARAFWAGCLLALVGWGALLTYHYVGAGNAVVRVGWSVLLTAALIPLHEGLHGLAYRLVGARRVSYHAQWRQLTFCAAADGFVVGGRPFALVALLPLATVSAGLLGWVAVGAPGGQVVATGALFWHTSACAGDIALLNFMWAHPQALTYDDLSTGRTYFYEAVP